VKVAFVSPIFETESDPGSDRYHYFCRHLVEKGHHVTVLTSAVAYKLARIRPECRGRWRTTLQRDGIGIIYLWSYANIRGSFARRLVYLFTYMCLAFLAGLLIERPDVIYTPNTPGMVGWIGYLLSRLRRVPLVYEVADVWPDAAIAMGTLTDPLVISLTRRMEMKTYKQASVVTALTCGIKANLEEKGLSPKKIVLVPNGVDPEIFSGLDHEKVNALRSELGLKDRFVGLYLGAHGHYNSLWTIIEMANLLRTHGRFAFLLIGDGDFKAQLISMVAKYRLSNVTFLAPIPRSDSSYYLALADVFLLPNRKGDFFRMNLPNKLFDYLISARPIIVAGEGDTADVVRMAKAGIIVPAEDAAAMADALIQLAALDTPAYCELGANGRQHAITCYHREAQARRIEQVLLSAISVNGNTGQPHVAPGSQQS
jgi:glycosyltransferase involved in cell wall biosynthesis